MKKIISSIILSALCLMPVLAQLDRSKAPEGGVAPKIQIGEPKSFTLKNGLKVFVVENHKTPVVTYSLSLDIKPELQVDKVGLHDFAGQLLMTGTNNRSKDQIDEEIDFIGASLNTSSRSVSGRSLKKFSGEMLSVMSDVLLNPIFPEDQLEKLKKQAATGISSSKEDPGSIANNISRKMLYGENHPYSEIMTESSVEAITVEDCKNYHSTYFRPNVAYLVIVGDITVKEAKKQAEKYFGKWKKADVPTTQYSTPHLNEKTQFAVGNKEGGNQSTVYVTHIVDLKPGHPDAIKVNVMNSVLGGGSFSAHLFQNLREDKAWTYGAYSTLSPDRIMGSFRAYANVKAEATDSALYEMMKEIKIMQQQKVDVKDLEQFKNMMAGSFARSLEEPSTVAAFALNIERYKLPKDYYATYLEKLAAVTVDDIQAMAQKYLKPENAWLIAVGDMGKIKPSLKRLTPDTKIVTYDFYGNEVIQKGIPAGVTAITVVEDYLKAIGGRERLAKVTNMVTDAKASIQGMTLNIKTYVQISGKMCVETYMQGNLMSKQVLNGKAGKISSPMGEQVLDEATVAALQDEVELFPELTYVEKDYKMELAGVEDINGETAYKVTVTDARGGESINYFSADSGLKLKQVKNTPQGQAITIVKEYAEEDGIKIPSKVIQSVGPQMIEMEITDIKLDTQILESIFAI